MTQLNAAGNLRDRPDVIWTFSDGTITPLDPDPADVQITDIAHALSNQCRFTGHVKYFYSVAEHSILVSRMVGSLEALLHDGSEAYLSDIARPIKHQPGFGEVYRAAEKKLEAAISERFGLTFPFPEEVYAADNEMLSSEMHALMPQGLRDVWPQPADGTPQPHCWSPHYAEELFLERFAELGGRA